MLSPVSSTLPSKSSSPTTGKNPVSVSIFLRADHPDFRVFLTGKEHVSYRKALNVLFTRKALGYVSPARPCDVDLAHTSQSLL